MCVFFNDTNLATILSLSLVVGFLFLTVILLLYLEGEGNVSGDGSTYVRLCQMYTKWLRSLWKPRRIKTEESVDEDSAARTLWQKVRNCICTPRTRRADGPDSHGPTLEKASIHSSAASTSEV